MQIMLETVPAAHLSATDESKERAMAGLSPTVRLIHDLQSRWGTIGLVVVVTAISIVSSLIVTACVLSFVDLDARHYATMFGIAALVPSLVAPPVCYAFSLLTDHLFMLEQQLQHRATHDALTGVPNRHAIMQCFQQALQAPDGPGGGVGVLMIDIDHFKSINDTHGHEAGDRVLKAVAATLSRSLRRTDRIGRYGGEEFLVLTSESSAEGLRASAERLRIALCELAPETVDVGEPVTASIGGAVHLGAGGEAAMSAALHRADEALYRAKRLGRNRVEIADTVLSRIHV